MCDRNFCHFCANSLFSTIYRAHDLSLPPSSHLRNGIDFLVNQSGLKAGCFLAMEAVDWVMERVSGATTRAEAVRVLQVSWFTLIHVALSFSPLQC